MTSALFAGLVMLAIIGAWNFLNMLLRIWCGERIAWCYVPWMIFGAWATKMLEPYL